MSERGSRRRLYDSSDLNLKILYDRIQRGGVMVTHRTLTPILWVRTPSSLPICPSGGIGRHTALKRLCCKACGFESRLGHHYGRSIDPLRVECARNRAAKITKWRGLKWKCFYAAIGSDRYLGFFPIGGVCGASGGRNGQPSPLSEMRDVSPRPLAMRNTLLPTLLGDMRYSGRTMPTPFVPCCSG